MKRTAVALAFGLLLAVGGRVGTAQPAPAGRSSAQVITTGTTATLTYSENVAKETDPVKGGGSLKDEVEKIARQIGQSSTAGTKAGAKLVLGIEPRVSPTPQSNPPPSAKNTPIKVTLAVAEQSWDVDADISSEHQVQLAAEHSDVLDQLGQWQVTLSHDERTAFEAGRKLSWNVTPPFANLALLSRPAVTVSVKLAGVDGGSATAVTIEEGP